MRSMRNSRLETGRQETGEEQARSDLASFPEPASSTKRFFLVFTLLQQFPATLLLNGQPFYSEQRFGWKAGEIALSQALFGVCIAFGAYLGGQIAHRRNPALGMTVGMVGCLFGAIVGLSGSVKGSAPILLTGMALFVFFQACVWPGLEAALMERETPLQVQNYVGLFNLIWSFGAATAFLSATPLMSAFGLHIFFALPILLLAFNLALFRFLPARLQSARQRRMVTSPPATPVSSQETVRRATDNQQRRRGIPAQVYRQLGWLANPMAVAAVNVVVSYNPTVQARLGLSFGAASVWCSLWFYVRTLSFELLRRWGGWHYRWGLLCGVFAAMMVSFAGITLAPNLPALMLSQVVFGFCVGFTYQSSLFYSMAESEAQGEHGGFHETVIGLGMAIGPLMVSLGAYLRPGNPVFPILLVLSILALGLAALIRLGVRARW